MEKTNGSTPDKLGRAASLQAIDLNSLIANVPGTIYRCAADREWTMAFMSAGIEKITGYPASDFVDNRVRSYNSVVHDDDQKMLRDLVADCLERKAPFEVEYRVLHANGDVRWVQEYGRGVFDISGRLNYVTGAIFDVTEQKIAEEKFTGLLEFVPDPTLIVDPQGLIASANAQTESLLGYAPGELIGKPIEFLVPERYRPGHEGHREHYGKAPTIRAMGSGLELSALHKDGSEVPVEISLGPLGPEGGDFVIASIRDITERAQAQEALRERERQLLEAARIACLGHYVWDNVTTTLIFCSEEYARIFGMSVEKCLARYSIGEDDIAGVHPDDRVRYKTIVYDQVTPDAPSYSIDYRILLPNSEIRHVHESSKTIFDATGNMLRTFGTIQDITKRVEAEQALRESEHMLTIAQQTAKLGYWVWRPKDDKPISISAEYRKLYGLADDEEIESFEVVYALVHPDDIERIREYDRSLSETPRDYTLEYRIARPNGEVVDVFERGIVDYDSKGNAIGIIGTTQDISERAQRERQLSQAARIAHLGHYVWDDVEERLAFCSEEYARIHGLSVEECLVRYASYENDIAAAHPDDRARYKTIMYDQVTPDALTCSLDFRLLRPDGEIRHVHQTSEVAFDAEGNLLRSVGTLQDITERVQAEQVLREGEARYREAARIAHLGHYVWNAITGEMVFCSEEYARIYGHSVEEIASAHSSPEGELALIHPNDRKRYYEQAYVLVKSEMNPIDIEYRIVRPDGEVRHLHEIGEPHLDDDGGLLGTAGTIQDITERVKAEEILRQSEEHLTRAQKIAALGSWEADLVTGEVRYSTGLDEVYGRTYSSNNFLEAHAEFLEWIHTDYREMYDCQIRNALERGEPFVTEYRLLPPGDDEKTISRTLRSRTRCNGPYRPASRHCPGHHRTQENRRAIASGAEDRNRGSADRRRRPRLQQSTQRRAGGTPNRSRRIFRTTPARLAMCRQSSVPPIEAVS